MTTTTALILGLAIGALLGALATVLVMRARAGSGTDGSAQASAQQLLQLAEQQFQLADARREADESARSEQLTRTLSPIAETLAGLERSVARTEAARQRADGDMTARLRDLLARTVDLGHGTQALVSALRAPTSRGQWGEVQLRRIVEAAGMLEHTDFTVQSSRQRADGEAGQRPDMIVHLSNQRSIVVDAKAPMDAYLEAMHAEDARQRSQALAAHAKALRGHVGALAKKSYWAALPDTPEFSVLFVPSDGVLAAALEAEPGLLDEAFTKDVVIASPSTLLALLRTVAHTWRTDALNKDAQQVLEAGRELHQRLSVFVGHLAKVGRGLDSSVGAFNEAVGSLNSRVLVTARKFEDLQVTGKAVEDVEQLTRRSRTLGDAEIADLARGAEPDAQTGRAAG